MSIQEKFRRLWIAKFPEDVPPQLECFDDQCGAEGTSIDIAAVEKNLHKSNELIAELNIRLRKQEFISDFLWETVHNFKESLPQSVAPKPPRLFPSHVSTSDDLSGLDEPIPLQDAASVSFSPGTDESGTSGPNSPSVGSSSVSLETGRNGPLVKQHSADCILSTSDSDIVQSQSSFRNKSVPLLDGEEEEEKRFDDSFHDGNRTRSLDSGKLLYRDKANPNDAKQFTPPLTTFRPNRPELPLPTQIPGQSGGPLAAILRGKKPKPVPAPRTSIAKPFVKGELSLAAGNLTPSPGLGSSPSPSPDANVAKDLNPKKTMRSFQSDTRNSAVINRRGYSSMKNLQAPPVLNAKPTMGSEPSEDKPRGRVNTSDSLVSRPLLTRTSESGETEVEKSTEGQKKVLSSSYDPTDYEEAMPVHREYIESNDASSDEDEPLYYNLMLLKQQTLNRVQTLYSKPGMISNPGMKPKPGAYQRLGLVKENESTGPSLSGDSVRSIGNDSVFEEKSGTHNWQKRRNMYSTSESVDSQSECDELDASLPPCPEDEKLQMRKWVITSILESERSYLIILDILMQYMQTFKNLLLGSAQAIISNADIEIIFSKIPELHRIHKLFVHDLEPKVENWSPEQLLADHIRTLALTEFKLAPEYLKNYPLAVSTIHRCWQENPQFALLTKEIQVKGMKEKPSLEELLHKPVVRFQRNTLVLHDLIKCTPTSHADYDTLMKTQQIAQRFLENFESRDEKLSSENQRYVAKQGLVVEKCENNRKLRHVFLFNDVFVCARQKISAKQKIHFEVKWFIPLIELSVDDKVCAEEEKLLADNQQQEIEALQRKVSDLQCELKSEMMTFKGNGDAQRQWSFHNKSKNMEKIKKRLVEQQVAMIKASPRLIFRVHNRRIGRQYTLLMASDYERISWRTTIADLLSRAQGASNISTTDLQNLLNSQKVPKLGTLASVVGIEDLRLEEEHLFGNLNIKIYRLQGLKHPADTYCTIEVDSFGHFFMKAKTKVVMGNIEPTYNEDFDVDLEGAQTIRILCYKMINDVATLIGSCALEMSKAWLRGDFQEKIVSINKEVSVTISLRYASREQTLKRTLSTVKGGLFGAKLTAVAKREGKNVPQLIQTCIEEVERRGMNELGIYRVSGVSGDIQRLKKAFEKNTNAAIQLAKDLDINVVTGLLKLYFRELPEALFTDVLYSNFVKGMGLSDPEAKEKYIRSILDSMPEPNRSTAFFLIDHLIKVAAFEQENKMTLQNLSTVFGPTLLRPAVKETQQQTLEELFSMGTRDAMMQSSILLYILTIRSKNARPTGLTLQSTDV